MVEIERAQNKTLEFTLLKRKPIYLRLDVMAAPLIVLLYHYTFGDQAFDTDHLLASVIMILSITLIFLIFLLNYWSVNANVLLGYFKLKDGQIEQCTNVRIVLENKKQHTIKRYIVPIIHNSIITQSGLVNKTYQIEFNKKRLLYNSDKKTFFAIPFPIHESIEFYQEAEGLQNEQEEKKAQLVWGQNKIDIPIPKFLDVYKEHLVAPFFVFQIFCSALWLMDEYWYFSLFTLFMLFTFEGTVVMQRLQNMKRLRTMRQSPFEVWTHRMGRWVKVQSDELYPGEVVLLRKNKVDKKFIVPLDLLLLSGSAVVNEAILTGESQPLVKESILHVDNTDDTLDIKNQHKVHILNGGTEILQFIPSENQDELTHLAKTPAPGIICFVLKNGFETKQGKLMRTILFSTERVTVESKETYFYLLILLCFALVASYYVLTEGLKDPDRSRQKLLLRCVLIITNVVPPELPMELSMAVNYSILQLVRKAIFCTEPFRIPFAGKVDVCCFDKTGTLTQNDLVIKGVTGLKLTEDEGITNLAEIHQHDQYAQLVLGGCHTIAVADNQLVGDPIEKQAFEGILFKHDGRRTSFPQQGTSPRILQIKRFLFESALKRMSTIVNIEENKNSNSGDHKVLAKGAPEVIRKYLREIPNNYDKCYLKYVKNGARVLALAYKNLPRMSAEQYVAIKREEAECDLIFCGFLVSECPLKPDTKRVINELVQARHMVKMITGDNQLTAAYIGKELKFGPSDKALFACGESKHSIQWIDIDDKNVAKTSTHQEVEKLAKEHMLCINGDVLDEISTSKDISKIIKYIHIFSRTSPNQKDFIVGMLNKEGHVTMMCGDGTNDVGSLKRANIGLAIVNNKDIPREDKKKRKQMSMWLKPTELQGLTPQQAREKQQKHMQEYMKTMQSQMGGPESGMPELGDACIAAPFTYKFSSLRSTIKLIQQGRTTLTTTFQMYKILSLNSLISAYTMSALYLDGVKMGDYQATCMGMAISILFMLISFSKPLKKLEKERPPTSIFHWSLVISVAFQFAVHLTVLIILVRMCEPYIDRLGDDSLIPDGDFKPNVKNSVLFLYQWWLQCTVITVNYSGRPFMEDLTENSKLYKYICGMFMIAAAGILDWSDIVREYLELVPFPNSQFQYTVIALLAADFILCYLFEKQIKRLYLKTFK